MFPSFDGFPKRKDLMSGVRVAASFCLLGNYKMQVTGTDKLLARGICS